MDIGLISLVIGVVLVIAASVIFLGSRKSEGSGSSQLIQSQLLEMGKRMADMQLGMQEGQNKNLVALSEQLNKTTSTVNQQLNQVTQVLNEQLQKTQGNINQQLAGATKVVTEVHGKLGELSKAAEEIKEVGKDISSLQDLLKAPKLRGNIGELFLEDLLAQLIPGRYQMQYNFPSGGRVDAAIFLENGIVPVDSKFPLESFNRMVKAETEEAKKVARREFALAFKSQVKELTAYIRPEEKTLDFAMMYIPAENVFYEVIIKDENLAEEKGLWNYALENKIIPTSPNSFYAYLMAIAYGLRGMQIEKTAQDIILKLGQLQKSFGKFNEHFDKVGNHIRMAGNNYDEARKRVDKLGDRIYRITGVESELDEPAIQELPLN